jgi:hypothetical protein
MAIYVICGQKLYIGEYDRSGDISKVGLEAKVPALETTPISVVAARTFMSGLQDLDFDADVYTSYAALTDSEPTLWANLAVPDKALSVYPNGAAANTPGYAFRSLMTKLDLKNKIGDIAVFNIKAKGSSVLQAGSALVKVNSMEGIVTKTATGNGTAYQVGTATANQRVYAFLHVIAASGGSPTLAVTVQSDDNSGMTSPTDSLAFTTATGITSEVKSAIGPSTDSWWRIRWVIGGTTPSFTFICGFGIE